MIHRKNLWVKCDPCGTINHPSACHWSVLVAQCKAVSATFSTYLNHQSLDDVFLMCKILRQGWMSKFRSAALYLFKAWTRWNQRQKIYACRAADDTDTSGTMMIDLSVIMMTLVAINSVKPVMMMIMSTILICVHVGLTVRWWEDYIWPLFKKKAVQKDKCSNYAIWIFFYLPFLISHSVFVFLSFWCEFRLMKWHTAPPVSEGHRK